MLPSLTELYQDRIRERVKLERAFVDWMRQIAEQVAPPGAAVLPLRTLDDVEMTLVERADEWTEQWRQRGREQGLAESREQGLAQQRALLCRMATERFGAETATCLADVVAPITDPERRGEVSDWLGRCDTPAEFLARLDPPTPS